MLFSNFSKTIIQNSFYIHPKKCTNLKLIHICIGKLLYKNQTQIDESMERKKIRAKTEKLQFSLWHFRQGLSFLCFCVSRFLIPSAMLPFPLHSFPSVRLEYMIDSLFVGFSTFPFRLFVSFVIISDLLQTRCITIYLALRV